MATKSAAKTAKAPAKAEKIEKAEKAEKVVKVEVVTLRHIGNALAEAHDMPKKLANEVLANMVAMVTTHLKKGAKIRIGGLGILQVRKRPARMGRNPATGEAIKIKASKKVAFRPAKDLKEAI
jgi:DNA-binding protein HU-beta